MRNLVGIVGILLVGGYMIMRDNAKKDADLAWVAKSLRSAPPAAIASDSRARRL